MLSSSRKTAAIAAHTLIPLAGAIFHKHFFPFFSYCGWQKTIQMGGFRDRPARFQLNTQLPETVLKNQLVLYFDVLLFCVHTCTDVLFVGSKLGATR